jgi:hypothetical protein
MCQKAAKRLRLVHNEIDPQVPKAAAGSGLIPQKGKRFALDRSVGKLSYGMSGRHRFRNSHYAAHPGFLSIAY